MVLDDLDDRLYSISVLDGQLIATLVKEKDSI
jgi:hypothetical protein